MRKDVLVGTDLIKVILWVAGIIAAACIIYKAIVEAIKISADGKLAVVKAELDHKEKMTDKLIAYHRQTFGASHRYFYSQDHHFTPTI
jgi:hypothetical protein